MTFTVREALELEPLREAGTTVLAGTGHLDRPVRWAHVAELPDIAHLLSGGELLLTTGMGIAGDPAAQRRYLREVADAGVAAVVIELGRNFASIPGEMVRDAETRGLPLVSLTREARFVDVTEAVHRAILRRQYELLDRAEHVSRELTEQILDGADVDEVVARVAGVLGADVVFEDEAHHVVAAAGDDRALGPLRARWESHARAGHQDAVRGAVHRTVASPPCTWVDVWIRHERWGRLHVMSLGGEAEDVRDLLVDRAGAALALSMLSKKDAAHLAERAENALLAELAAGRHGSVGELVRRARALGANLSRGRLAAICVELDLLPRPDGAIGRAHGEPWPAGPDARLDALHTLAGSLRASIEAHGCSALVGTSGDRLLSVVSVPGRRTLAAVLDTLVTDAVAQAERHASVRVVAGASGEVSPDALPRAIEEATVAAGFARETGARVTVSATPAPEAPGTSGPGAGAGARPGAGAGAGPGAGAGAGAGPGAGARAGAGAMGRTGRVLHHYDDLGTYQLLLRLADSPDLARFVDSELRPLLERDARAHPKLVPTLRTYLAHAGRKADAARALGIQRRTLYQRMAKIESSLSRDVDDQQTRTRLTLALQGLELLEARRKG